MSVDSTIDKIRSKDQIIDTANKIDAEQLTQEIVKVDSFLNGKIAKKTKEIENKLSSKNYKEFQKRIKPLKLEFNTELWNLQNEIDNIELDTKEEYRQLIESYQDIFDGMLDDIKEYEYILWNDENISNDELIEKVKEFSYTALKINENTYKNGKFKQLVKGIIDTTIIENIELAKQVFDTKWAILVDMVKTIFTWEGIKQIAKWLWKSIWDLFSGDAYKTGKSIWELWLITTGSGIAGMGLKKWAKIAMKQAVKKESKLLIKSAKILETSGYILQTPAKSALKTIKWTSQTGVKWLKIWEELIVEGWRKIKEWLESNDFGRILANERGGWGPIDWLKEELNIPYTIEVRTEDFIPDFVRENPIDIKNNTPRRLVDTKHLNRKINELLEELWDVTQKEKLSMVSKLILETLAKKDLYTAWHVIRVARYAQMLWEKLVEKGLMMAEELDKLKFTMLLHDVWKLTVDNNILRKVGKLTDEEFRHIRQHVNETETILKNSNLFDKKTDKDIIYGASLHHERPDGKWYPYGIKWDKIPEFAKISSIVDTFDAITSNRSYDWARSLDIASKILSKEAWKQFDSQFVKIFVEEVINQKKLKKVSKDIDRILKELERKAEIKELMS